jgi:hypothetical protein
MTESTPLGAATEALAAALVAVWEECEKTPHGGNLAECLSVALGFAAKRLTEDHPDQPPEPTGPAIYEYHLGTPILVKHRPGCWEAAHVLQLAYDPDLL